MRTSGPRTPRQSRTIALLLAASAIAPAACHREKPNAARDIRQNQDRYMDQMDQISKQIEADTKNSKSPDALTPPPAQDGTKPSPAASDPEKVPGG